MGFRLSLGGKGSEWPISQEEQEQQEDPKEIFGQKIFFGPKIVFGPHIFPSKKFVWPKILRTENIFYMQIFC